MSSLNLNDDSVELSAKGRGRRQAYYHGKYQREALTTLLLLAFAGMVAIRLFS